MPYITTDEVKKVRNVLKLKMPEFKFSVSQSDHSSLNIRFMAGPDIGVTNIQINKFHYHDEDRVNSVGKAAIIKLFKLIDETHPRVTQYEDADYGSIPNYYLNVSIGSWNKPYQPK